MDAIIASSIKSTMDIVGDTEGLLMRAMTLKWTSDDGKSMQQGVIEMWQNEDFNELTHLQVKNFCKKVINLTIRAVELDLASNKRWKNGSTAIAGLNFALVAVNPLLLLTGGGSAAAANEYKTCQREDERLLEDLRSTLNKY